MSFVRLLIHSRIPPYFLLAIPLVKICFCIKKTAGRKTKGVGYEDWAGKPRTPSRWATCCEGATKIAWIRKEGRKETPDGSVTF